MLYCVLTNLVFESWYMRKNHFALSVLAIVSYYLAVVSYLRLFYVVVAIAFCVTFILCMRGSLKWNGLLREICFPIFFFLYASLTILWAEYPADTITAIGIHLIFIPLFAVSYVMARNYSAKQLTKIFVYIPYAIALVFLYLYIVHGALRPYNAETKDAMGATANVSSTQLAIILPFLIWRMREFRSSQVAFFLSLCLILVAQSRTAYIIMILSLIVAMIINSKDISTFLVQSAKLTLGLVMIMGLLFLLPRTKDLIIAGYDRLVENDSYNLELSNTGAIRGNDVRKLMLVGGWQLHTEHPLRGIGFYNLSPQLEEKYGLGVVSHNLLISLLAELGWLGFLLYCVLVGRGIILLRRRIINLTKSGSERRTITFYKSCNASLILSVVAVMFYPPFSNPIFYISLGFVYSLHSYKELVVDQRYLMNRR